MIFHSIHALYQKMSKKKTLTLCGGQEHLLKKTATELPRTLSQISLCFAPPDEKAFVFFHKTEGFVEILGYGISRCQFDLDQL